MQGFPLDFEDLSLLLCVRFRASNFRVTVVLASEVFMKVRILNGLSYEGDDNEQTEPATVGTGDREGDKGGTSQVSNLWFCVPKLSGFEPCGILQDHVNVIYFSLC